MRKILFFTAAFLIAGSALAAGEIWRWKDSSGNWHYSDQPQAGAELVRRAGRQNTDAPTSAAPQAAAPSLTATDPASLPVSKETAAQVRQEAAAAKTAQCKTNDEAYQKAVQARVITRKDEKGNITYLTDAEIDAARLQARSARDLACGPGS